jgi:hypothetical protein
LLEVVGIGKKKMPDWNPTTTTQISRKFISGLSCYYRRMKWRTFKKQEKFFFKVIFQRMMLSGGKDDRQAAEAG